MPFIFSCRFFGITDIDIQARFFRKDLDKHYYEKNQLTGLPVCFCRCNPLVQVLKSQIAYLMNDQPGTEWDSNEQAIKCLRDGIQKNKIQMTIQ